MTHRSRAEEIAFGLVETFWVKNVSAIKFKKRPRKPLVDLIAKALSEYGAERAAEMRERCARLCESYSSNDELLHEAFKVVAEKIRSLSLLSSREEKTTMPDSKSGGKWR